jgi:hypothetical protein
MDGVIVGNGADAGAATRGWFVGHFMSAGPQQTNDVEVKWALHRRGERNGAIATNRTATSLSILIDGRFRLVFRDPAGAEETVVLRTRGEFALWRPGVGHDWEAEEDSILVTVRWPSKSGDQAE